jgi:putative ABC transport system ATP-binding protein
MNISCHGLFLYRRRPDGREHPVLANVCAEFAPGRITLVSGPTGAGKSTLLGLLASVLRPSQGDICVDAAAISRWRSSHRDRFRRNVGFVFQHANLLNDISAIDNVLLPLIPRGGTLQGMRRTAAAALDALGAAHLAAVSPLALSGGERQRVAFARALAADPLLILADEPTSFQDLDGVRRMSAIFEDFRGRGRTVIISGHDPRLAELPGLIDQRYWLENGRLEASP